ncbi:hypothetical protein Tco_0255661 [Tanacetum coccineum]
MFSYLLSQEEPKKIAEAYQDDSWIYLMDEGDWHSMWESTEIKDDERGFLWLSEEKKQGLVAPSTHRKEDEEVYVSQPPGYVIPDHPTKVYKWSKALMDCTKLLNLAEILKKFDLVNVKAAITPMETKVPLTKDEESFGVYVHLTDPLKGNSKDFSSQCCQEDLQVSQGQTKLGLMQITVGSILSSKSIADYGFNFMNTKIHIDNESTICIVKNPVYHSKRAICLNQ